MAKVFFSEISGEVGRQSPPSRKTGSTKGSMPPEMTRAGVMTSPIPRASKYVRISGRAAFLSCIGFRKYSLDKFQQKKVPL